MSGASGAIVAKIRSMYGKRLTPADYDEMLARSSVPAVAEYLASHPSYAPATAELKYTSVRRRQLEDAVRRARFSEFERLLRFEITVGGGLTGYIISTVEVETILRALYAITPGVADPPGTGSFSGSSYIDSHLSFDVGEVLSAKSVRKIADAVGNSRYATILYGFPQNADAVGFIRLEADLRAAYYTAAVAFFEDEKGGTACAEIAQMLRDRIDLENVVAAYRLKKYYNPRKEDVMAAMVTGGMMKMETLLKMADAADENAVLAASAEEGRMRKLLFVLDRCRTVDEAPVRRVFSESMRLIRFSTSAAAVMASYFNAVSVECDNVIKIIEGKRYGIPPSDIREMLILDEGR